METPHRRVQRVRIPNPSLDLVEHEGGQHAWVWAVPLPYRALTASWSGAPMPAAPDTVPDGEGRFEHQIGYYASLFSFLTYSFGWTRPDKGLLWWYTHGLPVEDDRLLLIRDTWERDGTLLGFLAWLSSMPADLLSSNTLAPWARMLDGSPLRLESEWVRRLDAAGKHEPWTGGSDPFHLGTGYHIAAPSVSDQPGAQPQLPGVSNLDLKSRSGTYVNETINGWYANLVLAGEQLPKIPAERSWRIDVYVKPIGFVGTYRRSRSTGLWFAGRHRFHAVGN